MADQPIVTQNHYSGALRRRFRLLPLAFAALLAIAVIGTLLRVFVMRMEPYFDIKPYKKQCEEARSMAGVVMAKASQKIHAHDLDMLKKRLEPKPPPTTVTNLSPTQGVATAEVVPPPVAPPKPRLLGIMFSETVPSLAVLGKETVKAGDLAGGWRVIEIQQEQVTIKDDVTGTTETLTLYEKRTKQD